MKIITEEEAKKLTTDEGVGIGFFMGGFSGKNKDMFIEVVRGEHYLIKTEEKGTKEYNDLMREQSKEGEEYLNDLKGEIYVKE